MNQHTTKYPFLPRTGSMTARMILLNVCVVIVTALTVSTVLHFINCQERIAELGADLEHMAAASVLLISADDHANIKTREDATSPAFLRLQSQIKALQEVYELPHDAIYTLRPVSTRHGTETEFITMLGTPYTGDRYILRPEMEEAIRTRKPTHTVDIYEDQYGQWLSGYAPILTSDGRVDGLLEVDYRADKVLTLTAEIRNQTILYTLLCVLIAIIFSVFTMRWMLRPLGTLVDALKNLQQGNYDHRIDASSTVSELETIATTFNGMIKTIAQRDKVLSASEKRYRTLFDEVQEALFLVHRQSGKVLDNNDAAQTLLQRPRADIQGTCLLELFRSDKPNDARATDIQNLRDLLNDKHPTEQNFTCSITRQTPHGLRFYNLKAAPLEVDSQDAWLITCQDTTQMREEWATLLQASKLTAIGEMAGGLAHQINNPLVGVLNFAQLLRQRLPEDDPNATLAATIEEAANRCRTVVRALLRFGRQEPHEPQTQIDLTQVIEESIILSSGQLHTLAGHVEQDIQDDLPTVPGNRNQLIQALLNLINNAVQASGEGAHITLRAFSDANFVHIDVIDQGPGVPKDIQDRIFEPFFTTKPEGEGTGLGLSVAYGILQHHGGSLMLLPTQAGATFRACIPQSNATPGASCPTTTEQSHV